MMSVNEGTMGASVILTPQNGQNKNYAPGNKQDGYHGEIDNAEEGVLLGQVGIEIEGNQTNNKDEDYSRSSG